MVLLPREQADRNIDEEQTDRTCSEPETHGPVISALKQGAAHSRGRRPVFRLQIVLNRGHALKLRYWIRGPAKKVAGKVYQSLNKDELSKQTISVSELLRILSSRYPDTSVVWVRLRRFGYAHQARDPRQCFWRKRPLVGQAFWL